jgi:hypothetical protein
MAVRLSALHSGSTLPPEVFFSASGTHCFSDSNLVRLEGLSKLKKFIHLIGIQTPDLLACSIVPQPTMLSRKSWLD